MKTQPPAADPTPEEVDRELARLQRRKERLLLANVGGRVALAVGSLALVCVGGETLLAGVGYLLAGALVWVEISRSKPRAPAAPTEDDGGKE